ncbi:UDP-glycosyltransferase UGT5-like [Portunus trituberculatus]|uniref:UDP-glucuronosyltransferase n=1 Tax=Portunus trituberculatus TaxID=210409 RepID=A0A5B7ECU2_PORTR|nr:UDP-glycosyltransferase UGT5-like [Portunus trituberculatus]MPC30604.1 UDP-glucuronosyltransferase 1-8 [Portunus trituberculatus]
MERVLACVLVVALAGSASGDLSPPEKSYKILMLLPVSSKSHNRVFQPLAEGLANRGHKVVMLTNIPVASKHPNISEVNHGLSYFEDAKRNMFEVRKNENFDGLKKTILSFAKNLYKVQAVMELYKRRKEFDLIVVNYKFNEMVYPFVHEVPFITIATPGIDPHQSAILGNILSPSYVPEIMFVPRSFPMSAYDRFKSILWLLVSGFTWRHWDVVPLIQKEISTQFPNLPPLLEIERNQSLTLMNTHFSIATVVPLLPSQVQVGAMHCRHGKPLAQDLESWLAGAGTAGVIYFSLGSVTRGESMPPNYRQTFLEAFRRLPQRILWKYEGQLEGAPDNVKISSWLPQQDILAHHNVKVFISHGGLLSLQESIFHATPLLVLPIFGDQPRNGKFVENSEIGHLLVWEELTADRIVAALTDIVCNPKFKENVNRVSASLRDQPTTPQEQAVYWTEYVIRHRGALQLRSPATQLSWVEFLMLDIVCYLLLASLMLILVIHRMMWTGSSVLFGDRAKKKTD